MDFNSRQFLIVNKAIGLKLRGNSLEANNLLDGADFSASSPLVKLGVACLRDDLAPALALLEPAKIADGLEIIALREWPFFQWARKDSDFCEKVSSVFGESISIEETESLIESTQGDAVVDDASD